MRNSENLSSTESISKKLSSTERISRAVMDYRANKRVLLFTQECSDTYVFRIAAAILLHRHLSAIDKMIQESTLCAAITSYKRENAITDGQFTVATLKTITSRHIEQYISYSSMSGRKPDIIHILDRLPLNSDTLDSIWQELANKCGVYIRTSDDTLYVPEIKPTTVNEPEILLSASEACRILEAAEQEYNSKNIDSIIAELSKWIRMAAKSMTSMVRCQVIIPGSDKIVIQKVTDTLKKSGYKLKNEPVKITEKNTPDDTWEFAFEFETQHLKQQAEAEINELL